MARRHLHRLGSATLAVACWLTAADAAAEEAAPAAAAAPEAAPPAPSEPAPPPPPLPPPPVVEPAPAAEPPPAAPVEPAAAPLPPPPLPPPPAVEPAAAATPALPPPPVTAPVVAPAPAVASPAAASPGTSAGVAAKAPAAEKPAQDPWRGTAIVYEHTTSAFSLNKDADPDYNPYYAHSISLRPEWHFGEYLVTRGNFNIEQELTNSDDTVTERELVWSDLSFDLAVSKLEDPLLGIAIGPSFRVAFPTSKVSAAATQHLSISPALRLSRKFDVLSGLVIGYSGRYTHRFHEYTTAQYDAPTIPCGDAASDSCANFISSGVRNVEKDWSHGPSISISPIDVLTLSADLTLRHAFLYGLSETPSDSLTAVANPEPDQDVRHATSFGLDLTWDVIDELSLSVGSSTFASQLGPDGQQRAPLFNRTTSLYLDLGINVGALISRI